MRKIGYGMAALLLLGLLAAVLFHINQLWVLALAGGLLAASLLFYFVATRPARRARRRLAVVDGMDGTEFEEYVAGLLALCGYKNVEITASTGDYGADLFACCNGLTYIFQCKRYAKNCGVKSVQEICGAKAHYASDVEVVVTNGRFTKNAILLAEETGVELWDRDVLERLVERR